MSFKKVIALENKLFAAMRGGYAHGGAPHRICLVDFGARGCVRLVASEGKAQQTEEQAQQTSRFWGGLYLQADGAGRPRLAAALMNVGLVLHEKNPLQASFSTALDFLLRIGSRAPNGFPANFHPRAPVVRYEDLVTTEAEARALTLALERPLVCGSCWVRPRGYGLR